MSFLIETDGSGAPKTARTVAHSTSTDRELRAHIGGLVVEVAVVEHLPVVLDALLSTAVHTVLQLLLDGPHVHGPLDDLEVVLEGSTLHHNDVMATRCITHWEAQCHWVHRLVEWPGIVVSPQRPG